MTFNLNHLLNFVQVVEWGNISKAAVFLNVAQPALSRQIHALEAYMDAPLLRRHSWGVEPTEDGKSLLEHARRIQKECVSARESVRSSKENPTGTVHLGVPSAYSVALVPPLLERMRALYPRISVHVVEAFSGTIYEWLVDGRVDIAILYGSNEHQAAATSPFLAEDMVALGTAEALGERDHMPMEDLAQGRLIAAWRPHMHRLALDKAFITLGRTFEPRIEIDSLPCMIELACRGDGIAILPPSCAVGEIASGRLAVLPLRPRLTLATVLGQTPDRAPTRAVRILTDQLRELAAELSSRTGWKVAPPGGSVPPARTRTRSSASARAEEGSASKERART